MIAGTRYIACVAVDHSF